MSFREGSRAQSRARLCFRPALGWSSSGLRFNGANEAVARCHSQVRSISQDSKAD